MRLSRKGAAGAAGGPGGAVFVPVGTGFASWSPAGRAAAAFSLTSTFAGNMIGILNAIPFMVTRDCVLDGLRFEVTIGAGGARGRVGIYRAISAANIYPGALVVDGGDKDTSGAGFVQSVGLGIPLSAGVLYWAVYLGGTAAITIRGVGPAAMSGFLGNQATDFSNANLWLSVAQAYGALPANFPAGAAPQGGNANVGGIFLNFSA